MFRFRKKNEEKLLPWWVEPAIYIGVSALFGGLAGRLFSQNNQQKRLDNTVRDYFDNPYSDRFYK